MTMLKISGAAMPAPASLTVRLEDSRFSLRRTLDGAASVSRAGVYRVVVCQWQYLTEADMALLLQAVSENAVMIVSYPDPATGQTRDMTACCTERSMGLMRRRSDGLVWTQVRVTFTEV